MQNAELCDKLRVRNGRYVCPFCKRTTYQKASSETSAKNLILWCRFCKEEFQVNIDSGQCSLTARAR